MITYYCTHCGSTNVLQEIAFMCEVNASFEMPSIGDTYSTSFYYCNECGDETDLTEENPNPEKEKE